MTKTIIILINLVVPGLGTLLGGKVVPGIIQLVMTIIAWVFFFSVFLTLLGAIIGGVSWLWALFMGINWDANKGANRAPPKSGIGR